MVRACPLLQERKYKIVGVSVLDVVEGSCTLKLSTSYIPTELSLEFTLEALPMMHSLLDTRPTGFLSQEQAIEWQYVIPFDRAQHAN